MDRPDWWPECPYPEDVFPMKRERYPEIVPDSAVRTALSGMLGRLFWTIASDAIWEQYQAAPAAEEEFLPSPGDEHAAGDIPEEMTPDTRPLSQQMSLDGMYSGIVEKWAKAVAELEGRIEPLEGAVRQASFYFRTWDSRSAADDRVEVRRLRKVMAAALAEEKKP